MAKKSIKFYIILAPFLLFLPFFCQADNVGDQTTFFVDTSYDASGRDRVAARLVASSERAYFYVELDWWNSLAGSQAKVLETIKALGIEFDDNIYPKITAAYGSPWEPGIDNDPRITILISRLREDAGGYFNSADEYSRSQAPSSNVREMVYLAASQYDSPRAKSFISHEFQHLISFYQKEKLHNVNEEVWLNEARSEYAPTVAGYDAVYSGSNLEKRVANFYKNPSDSLTEWGNTTVDYGVANLFMQYLVNHYGPGIISEMVKSPSVGIASIDAALESLNRTERFADVFMNWTIANHLNDCSLASGKYCYGNAILNEKIAVPALLNQTLPSSGAYSQSWADFVKDWSGHWYKFSGGHSNLKLSFNGGENTVFKVAYIIKKKDGSSQVKLMPVSNSQGLGFVDDLENIESVVLAPVSEKKIAGFNSVEPFNQFSFEVTLTDETINPVIEPEPPLASFHADGSLIRAAGDYKVYIVNNGYKRWIQNELIFGFYGHFKWASIIEIDSDERDAYQDSWMVRADGDYKVYEVNADGTKHWLNMTAQEFTLTGHKWDMVYIINRQERDWYRTGVDVKYR